MKRLVIFFSGWLICVAVAAADKSGTVSPWLYKKLTRIETLISEKKYTNAQQDLSKLLDSVNKGSYEQAAILRSLASVYALQGQYNKAAKALKQCLALDVLPEKQAQQAILNLGQMYLATEQYAKAVATLNPWLQKNPQPDAELSALLANAYAQLKQYRQALPLIQKAIKASSKPDDAWYQLNLAIYFELNEYRPAAILLKKLLQQHPDKKTYWGQLSSVYQQLKQFPKAASIEYLAYQKGLLKSEKEILEMANLLAYAGAPYQAGALLNDSMKRNEIRSNSKNWETLALIWQQAKEFDNAIIALEKASKRNQKGSLYLQLGQIYVEKEQWQKATDALNHALEKGGLKQTGAAYLLLGMSHYELKNLKQAAMAFKKAKSYPLQRKAAQQWLDFITEPDS